MCTNSHLADELRVFPSNAISRVVIEENQQSHHHHFINYCVLVYTDDGVVHMVPVGLRCTYIYIIIIMFPAEPEPEEEARPTGWNAYIIII